MNIDTVERTIFEACLVAAAAMGDDLLKMSCFASNWHEIDAQTAAEDLPIAA